MNSIKKPLEGITVISLEHAVAAPICTRHLADLGARVIKIERPDSGDFARDYDDRVNGLASYFVWANRGKESLALDIKQELAHKVLMKLIANADILVQNLAPGASARLGLSYEQLKDAFPRLIVCDISGYGLNGPYSHKKAYDLLIQSESGFLSTTGSQDAMAKAGISIADISAGIYAYNSILAALLWRNQHNEGCHLDVSMLEALVEWMGYPLYYAYQGAEPPSRAGASHATIYPYGPFSCQDGIVMFGLQNDHEWASFCQHVLLNQDLANDERFNKNGKRSANRDALNLLIHDVFNKLSHHDIITRLNKANIANAKVNTMADIWQHPQLAARQRWEEINSPVGRLPALLPPVINNRFEYAMGAVPALGEHNLTIFKALDLSEEDIANLTASTTTP